MAIHCLSQSCLLQYIARFYTNHLTVYVEKSNITFVMETLRNRDVRTVYLITYSQADIDRFNNQSFATLIVDAFTDEEANVRVMQWVCCRERHQDGGYHFHMAIKLNKLKRWLTIRRILSTQHNIEVNFSGIHNDYYSAWSYVTKEHDFMESVGHPDLTSASIPRTTNALASRRRGTIGNASGPAEKKSRLDNLTVNEAILKNNIKSTTELLALADMQKKNGKKDLASFILNKGLKKVGELIETTWTMENASGKLLRDNFTRMEILETFLEKPCVEKCGGLWLTAAIKTLQDNDIGRKEFSAVVIRLLREGRKKYTNILIIGPTNCGKTFMLLPLTVIYKCFENPASTSFAWVGVENEEIILLNDLRWSPNLITWNNFLLLLEGQPLHFPAPKSHYCKDIFFDKDTPIFATSSKRISLVKGGMLLEKETEMMSVRWHVFEFTHQIPPQHQRDIPPCGTCFAKLLLLDE